MPLKNLLLGQVAIGGKDVIKESIKTKKPLAYISENLILYPNLSGVENLNYFSGLADKYSPAELSAFLLEAVLKSDAHHQRVNGYLKEMRPYFVQKHKEAK